MLPGTEVTMFGFLFGTACLVGLFWVFKRGHHGGACGYGYGRRHHGRWHGDGSWAGERSSWMLRWIYERLDTTPGQEKVIRSAVEEVMDKAREAKQTIKDSRGDVARAFRADDFNAEILGDVFSRHDGALDELRKTAVGALAKVHDVLDERQRARLAELLESMPGRRWGGPYRSGA
jgi:hypothetical protein